jgi:hypothetical protein
MELHALHVGKKKGETQSSVARVLSQDLNTLRAIRMGGMV